MLINIFLQKNKTTEINSVVKFCLIEFTFAKELNIAIDKRC